MTGERNRNNLAGTRRCVDHDCGNDGGPFKQLPVGFWHGFAGVVVAPNLRRTLRRSSLTDSPRRRASRSRRRERSTTAYRISSAPIGSCNYWARSLGCTTRSSMRRSNRSCTANRPPKRVSHAKAPRVGHSNRRHRRRFVATQRNGPKRCLRHSARHGLPSGSLQPTRWHKSMAPLLPVV